MRKNRLKIRFEILRLTKLSYKINRREWRNSSFVGLCDIVIIKHTVRSDLNGAEEQNVGRHARVRNVAHVGVRRLGVGAVRRIREQGDEQAQNRQVLRGPFVLDARLGGRVRRVDVHGPMAERRRRVCRAAVSVACRPVPGQGFQPVHRLRVVRRHPHRCQPARRQIAVSTRMP